MVLVTFYRCLLFQAIPASAEQQLVDFLLSNPIQRFDVTDTPDVTSNLIQRFDVTDTPDVTSNLIQRFDVTDTPLPDINSEGERKNSLTASF